MSLIGTGLKAILSPVGGLVSSATDSLANAGLNAIGSWVLSGTESALRTVAKVIGTATAPNLESTWFGSAYWRVAGLATLLTMPFLFAAAVQALVRSDLGLLMRSAFLYLPVALIAVGLAAPVTMLLLSATDQMSAAVSAIGVEGGATFLDSAARAAATYAAVDGSPFFAVVVGMFALMAALVLAIEMLIREAAVYVVVLMLPLGFAAMVWPARRIWATRLIELLISLILSKFVIVAVLSLAGAAFAHGNASGISQLLVAMTLMMLSVFAPWTLMRILPFAEVAAGAAGALRRELPIPSNQEMAQQGLAKIDPALGVAARLAGGAGRSAGQDGPEDGFAPGSAPSAVGAGTEFEDDGVEVGSGTSASGGRDAGGLGGGGEAVGSFVGESVADGASRPGPGGAASLTSNGGGALGDGAGGPGGASGGSRPNGDPRPPMDDHWALEWEDLRLDGDLVTGGLRYTPPGSDQQTRSLAPPPLGGQAAPLPASQLAPTDRGDLEPGTEDPR